MKSFTSILSVIAFILGLLISSEAIAQAPQLFNYQGIARDAKGNPLSGQKLSLKIALLQASDATEPEYEEIQTVITNEFGLYTLQIGGGVAVSGGMKNVKWETGNKYIRVAIDPNGGNEFVDAGSSQLLSVPYAMYADKAGQTAHSDNDKTRTGAVNSNAAHVVADVNYISKFTALNIIGKSLLYDNGTNIGIGTTTPSARFQINQNVAATQEHIRMQNLSAAGAGRFTMYNDITASYASFTKYGNSFAGGYAGITTKYPYSNLMAFGNNGPVAGDGKGRFLISSAGNIGISLAKGGTSKLKFHTDFTTENVSIGGNADPVNRVHLNNTDGTDLTLGLTNNTSGHTAADGLLIRENGNAASVINKENGTLSLGTNNTTAITILPNGDMGIGTLTPAGKLDVNGQIRIQGGLPGFGKVLTSDSTGVASWKTPTWVTGYNGFDTYLPKFFGGGDTLLNSSIADNGLGQVGIGTLFPTHALHIHNSTAIIRLEDWDDNTSLYLGAPDPSNLTPGRIGTTTFHELNFFTNNVNHFVIKADGKIGINTNTPTADFEVNGNFKADTIFATTFMNGGGTSHYVGEIYGGGVVYFVYKDTAGAEHGLIVSLAGLGGNIWSDAGAFSGAASSTWNGFGNSAGIVSQPGHSSSAAQLCLNLVSGGQSDWYLPSIDELNLLYNSRFVVSQALSTIPGATELGLTIHWSSTEASGNSAYSLFFATAAATLSLKTQSYAARAIRKF